MSKSHALGGYAQQPLDQPIASEQSTAVPLLTHYSRGGCATVVDRQREDASTVRIADSAGRTARAVSIRGDTVVKVQEPVASRRERLRTVAGREVGLRTGLFVVPEILSYDDSRGEIVFERLELTWLRETLSQPARSMDVVSRAAAALAAIHRDMQAIEGATRAHAGGLSTGSARTAVPLHGDYGMRNVFYLPTSDRLAIIDWSNAGWIGFDADLGPPEIDIAVFLMSLFHRRVFGPWPISRRRDVARRFLAVYSSDSAQGLDIDTLAEIVAASRPRFDEQTRRRKGNLLALGYRHNMVDLQMFLHRLSAQGFAKHGERRTG